MLLFSRIPAGIKPVTPVGDRKAVGVRNERNTMRWIFNFETRLDGSRLALICRRGNIFLSRNGFDQPQSQVRVIIHLNFHCKISSY